MAMELASMTLMYPTQCTVANKVLFLAPAQPRYLGDRFRVFLRQSLILWEIVVLVSLNPGSVHICVFWVGVVCCNWMYEVCAEACWFLFACFRIESACFATSNCYSTSVESAMIMLYRMHLVTKVAIL